MLVPAARPSSPSVRFTPFAAPAMIRKSSTYQNGPSGIDQSPIGTNTECDEVLVVRGDADGGGDQRQAQHLPAAAQAERALVAELV